MRRLEKVYNERVAPELKKQFGYKSSMEIPRVEKISLNIGLGEASQNSKLIDEAVV
jgi:large subunit ribosomal protein L5